jgi:hypothetical protein
MKLSTLITLVWLAFFATSCNVTETIVFNEQMGGTYKTTFDFSSMLAMANEGRPDSVEREVKEAIDTTIVFDDFFVQYKDSIATLPSEKQAQLKAMKGAIIDIHMDEEKEVFNFTMIRPFVNFDELKLVNEQLDGAMDIAQSFGKKDTAGGPPKEQMDELTKTEQIIYTYSNNTFTRFQPKKETVSEPLEGEEEGEVEEQPSNADSMNDMIEVQFEEMFKAAFYTMVYTFPKPIKSVSNKNAVISKDRRTMTLQINLSESNKDATLMDLEVILEN